MRKSVVTILISVVVGVVMAGHPFREESCCQKPILTKSFRQSYHDWKTLCGQNDLLDFNCWADCVFKKGSTEKNSTWQQLLQDSVEKEPNSDLEWKMGIIKKVVEECKNPNQLIKQPCQGTNDHIETLRCGLRIIENSCPEGMWNTTDPLCEKH